MSDDTPSDDGDDFLAEVREKFERAAQTENDNRNEWKDDVRFAKLGEQWPQEIKRDRDREGRPCLVINRMPAFIRQVVNQARDNRPAMEVIPADSNADPETAEIMSGLIRNIEVSSDADIAYDTAIEAAVAGGFGYFRLNIAATSDDSFDKDITVERIADPLTVYGDPDSESVDGSDWNCAFIVSTMTKDEFEAKYKGKDAVNWEELGYSKLSAPWFDGEKVMLAEYWHREDVDRQIIALSNDTVVDLDEFEEKAEEYQAIGVEPIGKPQTVKSKKVTQYVLSGAEVLETVEWPGKFIPIVPVYGDEVMIEGKRTFKSLIRDAKDAQREHNYWRSMAAETIALAPKVPFIGEEGAFDADPEKWSTANDSSHSYIEYTRGQAAPMRQNYAGPSAGELQQAIAAIDDMKSIMGIFDASLGQKSNETSGVAIRQRQRQGDVATFHFLDNLNRSIRQAGRIVIDLIAKVYSTQRVIRTLGQDMKPQNVQIDPNAPPAAQQQKQQQAAQAQGQAIARIYDVTAGKYDLIVKAGPSFGSQREQTRAELVEIVRAFPAAAPVLGPMVLKNSDWPGADDAADKLEAMSQGQQGPNPQQVQQQMGQMQGALQQAQQKAAELEMQNRELKAGNDLKAFELQIKKQEADTRAFEAQSKAQAEMIKASQPQMPQQSSNPYAL